VRTTHVYNVRFGIAMTSFDSTAEGNLVANFSADGIRVTRDGENAASCSTWARAPSAT